jgi:undecaprenyl pyrophosphate phosphatase UppP
VSKHSFNGFAVYRVIIGLAVFGLLGADVIQP